MSKAREPKWPVGKWREHGLWGRAGGQEAGQVWVGAIDGGPYLVFLWAHGAFLVGQLKV